MKTSKNDTKAVFTHRISAKTWCKNCTTHIFFSVYTLRLRLIPALYTMSKMYLNIINTIYHYSNTLSIFLPFFICFSRPGHGYFPPLVMGPVFFFAEPGPDFFFQKMFPPPPPPPPHKNQMVAPLITKLHYIIDFYLCSCFTRVGSHMSFVWIHCTEKCQTSFPQ